ncbi:MAG: UTP--glucose-1-phosphate uridylyltransferase, partial [Candidatus Omnitrophica bacterium]|nr:UTP--glucose-1-phosphate uridylyltransferase [Candidatus Omnitrophota bacterium]
MSAAATPAADEPGKGQGTQEKSASSEPTRRNISSDDVYRFIREYERVMAPEAKGRFFRVAAGLSYLEKYLQEYFAKSGRILGPPSRIAYYDLKTQEIVFADRLREGSNLDERKVKEILLSHHFSAAQAKEVISFIYEHENLHAEFPACNEEVILQAQAGAAVATRTTNEARPNTTFALCLTGELIIAFSAVGLMAVWALLCYMHALRWAVSNSRFIEKTGERARILTVYTDFEETVTRPYARQALQMDRVICSNPPAKGFDEAAFLGKIKMGREKIKAQRDGEAYREFYRLFRGLLKPEHCRALADSWELNDNDLKTLQLIRRVLGVDGIKLVTVGRGFRQPFQEFFKRPEIIDRLGRIGIKAKPEDVIASELEFDKQAVATGEVVGTLVINKLDYLPKDSLFTCDDVDEQLYHFKSGINVNKYSNSLFRALYVRLALYRWARMQQDDAKPNNAVMGMAVFGVPDVLLFAITVFGMLQIGWQKIRLFASMKIHGMPLVFMADTCIPTAFAAVKEQFAVKDQQAARLATLESARRMSSIDVHPCSTVFKGVPLAAEWAKGSVANFILNLKELERKTGELQERNINAVKTYMRAQELSAELLYEHNPRNFGRLLNQADEEIGAMKTIAMVGAALPILKEKLFGGVAAVNNAAALSSLSVFTGEPVADALVAGTCVLGRIIKSSTSTQPIREIGASQVISLLKESERFPWGMTTRLGKAEAVRWLISHCRDKFGPAFFGLNQTHFNVCKWQELNGHGFSGLYTWAVKRYHHAPVQVVIKELLRYLKIKMPRVIINENNVLDLYNNPNIAKFPWGVATKQAKLFMIGFIFKNFPDSRECLRLMHFDNPIPEFNGRTLYSLINWASNQFLCKSEADAVLALKKHLGIRDRIKITKQYEDWDATKCILRDYPNAEILPARLDSFIDGINRAKIGSETLTELAKDAKQGNSASRVILLGLALRRVFAITNDPRIRRHYYWFNEPTCLLHQLLLAKIEKEVDSSLRNYDGIRPFRSYWYKYLRFAVIRSYVKERRMEKETKQMLSSVDGDRDELSRADGEFEDAVAYSRWKQGEASTQPLTEEVVKMLVNLVKQNNGVGEIPLEIFSQRLRGFGFKEIAMERGLNSTSWPLMACRKVCDRIQESPKLIEYFASIGITDISLICKGKRSLPRVLSSSVSGSPVTLCAAPILFSADPLLGLGCLALGMVALNSAEEDHDRELELTRWIVRDGFVRPGLRIIVDDSRKSVRNFYVQCVASEYDSDAPLLNLLSSPGTYIFSTMNAGTGDFLARLSRQFDQKIDRLVLVASDASTEVVCHEILHDVTKLSSQAKPNIYQALSERIYNILLQDEKFLRAFSKLSETDEEYLREDCAVVGKALHQFISVFFALPLRAAKAANEYKDAYAYVLKNMPTDARELLFNLGFIWPEIQAAIKEIPGRRQVLSKCVGYILRRLKYSGVPPPKAILFKGSFLTVENASDIDFVIILNSAEDLYGSRVDADGLKWIYQYGDYDLDVRFSSDDQLSPERNLAEMQELKLTTIPVYGEEYFNEKFTGIILTKEVIIKHAQTLEQGAQKLAGKNPSKAERWLKYAAHFRQLAEATTAEHKPEGAAVLSCLSLGAVAAVSPELAAGVALVALGMVAEGFKVIDLSKIPAEWLFNPKLLEKRVAKGPRLPYSPKIVDPALRQLGIAEKLMAIPFVQSVNSLCSGHKKSDTDSCSIGNINITFRPELEYAKAIARFHRAMTSIRVTVPGLKGRGYVSSHPNFVVLMDQDGKELDHPTGSYALFTEIGETLHYKMLQALWARIIALLELESLFHVGFRTRLSKETPAREEVEQAFAGLDLRLFTDVANTSARARIDKAIEGLDTIGLHQAARRLEALRNTQHIRAPPAKFLQSRDHRAQIIRNIFNRSTGVLFTSAAGEWIIIAPDVLEELGELESVATFVHEAGEAAFRNHQRAEEAEFRYVAHAISSRIRSRKENGNNNTTIRDGIEREFAEFPFVWHLPISTININATAHYRESSYFYFRLQHMHFVYRYDAESQKIELSTSEQMNQHMLEERKFEELGNAAEFDAIQMTYVCRAVTKQDVEQNNHEPDAKQPISNELTSWSDITKEDKKAGEEILRRRGAFASLLLNGGLASRFGGTVKALFVIIDNWLNAARTFIDVKLGHIFAIGKRIPVYIANSYSTHDRVMEYLEERNNFGLDIRPYRVGITKRLTKEGEIFRLVTGEEDFCPGGHFEAIPWLVLEGKLGQMVKDGTLYVSVSNIDNLGATIDPGLIGILRRSGKDVLVEVVDKAIMVSVVRKSDSVKVGEVWKTIIRRKTGQPISVGKIVKNTISPNLGLEVCIPDEVTGMEGTGSFTIAEAFAQDPKFKLAKHIKIRQAGADVTDEYVITCKPETGGTVCEVRGRNQLVEGFCFDKSFNQNAIPEFNTATYILRVSGLLKLFNYITPEEQRRYETDAAFRQEVFTRMEQTPVNEVVARIARIKSQLHCPYISKKEVTEDISWNKVLVKQLSTAELISRDIKENNLVERTVRFEGRELKIQETGNKTFLVTTIYQPDSYLLGDITAALDALFVTMDRTVRFHPVKQVSDKTPELQELLKTILGSRVSFMSLQDTLEAASGQAQAEQVKDLKFQSGMAIDHEQHTKPALQKAIAEGRFFAVNNISRLDFNLLFADNADDRRIQQTAELFFRSIFDAQFEMRDALARTLRSPPARTRLKESFIYLQDLVREIGNDQAAGRRFVIILEEGYNTAAALPTICYRQEGSGADFKYALLLSHAGTAKNKVPQGSIYLGINSLEFARTSPFHKPGIISVLEHENQDIRVGHHVEPREGSLPRKHIHSFKDDLLIFVYMRNLVLNNQPVTPKNSREQNILREVMRYLNSHELSEDINAECFRANRHMYVVTRPTEGQPEAAKAYYKARVREALGCYARISENVTIDGCYLPEDPADFGHDLVGILEGFKSQINSPGFTSPDTSHNFLADGGLKTRMFAFTIQRVYQGLYRMFNEIFLGISYLSQQLILSQMPRMGRGFTLIGGSDNVICPGAITWDGGRPLAELPEDADVVFFGAGTVLPMPKNTEELSSITKGLESIRLALLREGKSKDAIDASLADEFVNTAAHLAAARGATVDSNYELLRRKIQKEALCDLGLIAGNAQTGRLAGFKEKGNFNRVVELAMAGQGKVIRNAFLIAFRNSALKRLFDVLDVPCASNASTHDTKKLREKYPFGLFATLGEAAFIDCDSIRKANAFLPEYKRLKQELEALKAEALHAGAEGKAALAEQIKCKKSEIDAIVTKQQVFLPASWDTITEEEDRLQLLEIVQALHKNLNFYVADLDIAEEAKESKEEIRGGFWFDVGNPKSYILTADFVATHHRGRRYFGLPDLNERIIASNFQPSKVILENTDDVFLNRVAIKAGENSHVFIGRRVKLSNVNIELPDNTILIIGWGITPEQAREYLSRSIEDRRGLPATALGLEGSPNWYMEESHLKLAGEDLVLEPSPDAKGNCWAMLYGFIPKDGKSLLAYSIQSASANTLLVDKSGAQYLVAWPLAQDARPLLKKPIEHIISKDGLTAPTGADFAAWRKERIDVATLNQNLSWLYGKLDTAATSTVDTPPAALEEVLRYHPADKIQATLRTLEENPELFREAVHLVLNRRPDIGSFDNLAVLVGRQLMPFGEYMQSQKPFSYYFVDDFLPRGHRFSPYVSRCRLIQQAARAYSVFLEFIYDKVNKKPIKQLYFYIGELPLFERRAHSLIDHTEFYYLCPDCGYAAFIDYLIRNELHLVIETKYERTVNLEIPITAIMDGVLHPIGPFGVMELKDGMSGKALTREVIQRLQGKLSSLTQEETLICGRLSALTPYKDKDGSCNTENIFRAVMSNPRLRRLLDEKVEQIKIARQPVPVTGIFIHADVNEQDFERYLLGEENIEHWFHYSNTINFRKTHSPVAHAFDFTTALLVGQMFDPISSAIMLAVGIVSSTVCRALREVEMDELDRIFPEGLNKAHNRRVSEYVSLLGREMRLKEELIDMVTRVAKVHDIGGIHIPLTEGGSFKAERELARNYGLPANGSKKASLVALEVFLKKRPDLAAQVLTDESLWYMSMARVLAAICAQDGNHLTLDQIERYYAHYSHEYNGVRVLRERFGIKLAVAEEFLITNHFCYPEDPTEFEHVAKTSGITAKEIRLMLDILIFCDVWENGNNAERLMALRRIPYQSFATTFEKFDEFYGERVADKAGLRAAMIRLLVEGDSKIRETLIEARPVDSSDAIKAEEFIWAKQQVGCAESSTFAALFIPGLELMLLPLAVGLALVKYSEFSLTRLKNENKLDAQAYKVKIEAGKAADIKVVFPDDFPFNPVLRRSFEQGVRDLKGNFQGYFSNFILGSEVEIEFSDELHKLAMVNEEKLVFSSGITNLEPAFVKEIVQIVVFEGFLHLMFLRRAQQDATAHEPSDEDRRQVIVEYVRSRPELLKAAFSIIYPRIYLDNSEIGITVEDEFKSSLEKETGPNLTPLLPISAADYIIFCDDIRNSLTKASNDESLYSLFGRRKILTEQGYRAMFPFEQYVAKNSPGQFKSEFYTKLMDLGKELTFVPPAKKSWLPSIIDRLKNKAIEQERDFDIVVCSGLRPGRFPGDMYLHIVSRKRLQGYLDLDDLMMLADLYRLLPSDARELLFAIIADCLRHQYQHVAIARQHKLDLFEEEERIPAGEYFGIGEKVFRLVDLLRKCRVSLESDGGILKEITTYIRKAQTNPETKKYPTHLQAFSSKTHLLLARKLLDNVSREAPACVVEFNKRSARSLLGYIFAQGNDKEIREARAILSKCPDTAFSVDNGEEQLKIQAMMRIGTFSAETQIKVHSLNDVWPSPQVPVMPLKAGETVSFEVSPGRFKELTDYLIANRKEIDAICKRCGLQNVNRLMVIANSLETDIRQAGDKHLLTAEYMQLYQLGAALFPMYVYAKPNAGLGSRWAVLGSEDIAKGTGIVPVYGGRSFNEITARVVQYFRDKFGIDFPFLTLTSFSTDGEVRDDFVRQGNYGLDPATEFYLQTDKNRRFSMKDFSHIHASGVKSDFTPAGHFGLIQSLITSGQLYRLLHAKTKKHIYATSNIDNLVAFPEPVLMAMFYLSGKTVMSEVSVTTPQDIGGYLVNLKEGCQPKNESRQQIVERSCLSEGIKKLAKTDFATFSKYFRLFHTANEHIYLPDLAGMFGITEDELRQLDEAYTRNTTADIERLKAQMNHKIAAKVPWLIDSRSGSGGLIRVIGQITCLKEVFFVRVPAGGEEGTRHIPQKENIVNLKRRILKYMFTEEYGVLSKKIRGMEESFNAISRQLAGKVRFGHPGRPMPLPTFSTSQSNPITNIISRKIENELKNMALELGMKDNEGHFAIIKSFSERYLAQIADHLKLGLINPNIKPALHRGEVCDINPRPFRIGVYPVAANPFTWMHLIAGLAAIAEYKLDKIIYVIAGSDPRKASSLLADHPRHIMAQKVLKMFDPLFAYCPIASGTPLDGETNIFRILNMNSHQKIEAFYMVGRDHYNRWARLKVKDRDGADLFLPDELQPPNSMERGRPEYEAWVARQVEYEGQVVKKAGEAPKLDTIQKLEDNVSIEISYEVSHLDPKTGVEVKEKKIVPYSDVLHKVSAIFFEREVVGETIETTLDANFIIGMPFEVAATTIRQAFAGKVSKNELNILPYTAYCCCANGDFYGAKQFADRLAAEKATQVQPAPAQPNSTSTHAFLILPGFEPVFTLAIGLGMVVTTLSQKGLQGFWEGLRVCKNEGAWGEFLAQYIRKNASGQFYDKIKAGTPQSVSLYIGQGLNVEGLTAEGWKI